MVKIWNNEEVWDLYDKNRNLLGKSHLRGEKIPKDCYHLVVNVWIKNKKGEYLITKRSGRRLTYPLMWECVTGSVLKGEESIDGAVREVKEEVGIDLDGSKGRLLFSKVRKNIDGIDYNDILDVWLFEYDGEVDLCNATTDEVEEVALMNKEDIEKLKEQKIFMEALEYFFTEIEK